jgi:hypothetical protein
MRLLRAGQRSARRLNCGVRRMFGRHLQALSKWLLSFVKGTWELEDYPVEIRMQRTDPKHVAVPKYAARIINWWALTGLGETETEARENLRAALAEQAKKGPLPRPGAKVPIKFASVDEISRFEALATDFFPAILGHELSQCFVSDESSLIDFGGEWSNYCSRVLLRYKVDISDLEPGNLVRVFERIDANRQSA